MAQIACLALVGTRRWPEDQRMLCWGEPVGFSLQWVKSGHNRLTIEDFTTTLARKNGEININLDKNGFYYITI